MHPRTLALIVAFIVVLAVGTPLVMIRYFLTPSSIQTVISQQP
jgi:hypothetical protein